MPNWWEGPVATFDLETTGLDVLEDRIVQAAILVIELDGTTREGGWSGLTDPGVKIPAEATEIHDITDEMVARIDATLGAGEDLPLPVPEDEAAPSAADNGN